MCFNPEEKESLYARIGSLEKQYSMLRGMGLIIGAIATFIGGYIITQLNVINHAAVQSAVMQVQVANIASSVLDLKQLQQQNQTLLSATNLKLESISVRMLGIEQDHDREQK